MKKSEAIAKISERIVIHNLHNESFPALPNHFRVDRGFSTLGNPFRMESESQRTAVVQQYTAWFTAHANDSALRIELVDMLFQFIDTKQVHLYCWCAPALCHGDVIKNFLVLTLVNRADEVYQMYIQRKKKLEAKAPIVKPSRARKARKAKEVK